MSTKIQERIKLFRFVREIPYYISVGNEQDFSCSTKAEILQRLLGLQSRFRICEFRWEDLRLPKEILALGHEDPEVHQFLEVLIPETQKWVIVDPTWDSGLATILPISEWDGINDTQIAVSARKIYSPQESDKIVKKISTPEEIENYLRKNKNFLVGLNNYFRSLRGG